jgi:acyl-CoA thioester hydrolase
VADDNGRFVQRIRVRYGECDMQGVVFNAHYLTYIDDTIDQWFHATIGSMADAGFDYMVKKAAVEWASPAHRGEVLVLSPVVSRWGNTSFDITVSGAVDGRPVFTGTLTCVSVAPGTATPCPVPERVRAILTAGDPADV